MSFENYEQQKKFQKIQHSILKQKHAIEKKSKWNIIESLLEVESELQLCLTNITACINLVNSNVQTDSIQNCLLPTAVEHLKICRNDANLFRRLFHSSLFMIELFESVKHNCTKNCTFNPIEDAKIIPLNEARKFYIQHLKLLKISCTVRKSLLMLMSGGSTTNNEKIDDMEIYPNDSTCSFHVEAVCTSSPILKEKTDDQK